MIKNFLKKTLKYIAKTKIGKLLASSLLAGISFTLAGIYSFMSYVGLAFMIYPVGLVLVMICYAWIINPIKNWKKNNKLKNIPEPIVPLTESEANTKSEIYSSVFPVVARKSNSKIIKKRTTKKTVIKKKPANKKKK